MRRLLTVVLWLVPSAAAADILPPPSRPEFDTPLPMPEPPPSITMLGLALLLMTMVAALWLLRRAARARASGKQPA